MDSAIIVALIAALSSGGVCSIILYLIQRKDNKILKRLEEIEKKLDEHGTQLNKIKRAEVAGLHTSVRRDCEQWLTETADGKRTYIDTDDMHDLSIRYEAYRELGGNGICAILYSQVQKIPLKQTNAMR